MADHMGEFENADNAEEAFKEQQKMKIERQRQRAELEATKEQKERSAGELALLFMGINQVAFELLIENPMTGYMNEIIFSRILGMDDIEQGNFWVDTTLCYICNKWNKATIQVDPRVDQGRWATKITQIENTQEMVEQLSSKKVELELIAEAEAAKKKKNKKLDEEDEAAKEFAARALQGSLARDRRKAFRM